MSEPQEFGGLMWQIHELKQQLADAEKRGAVKALRAWADFATSELEHCPTRERHDEAVLMIKGIRSEASHIESGQVTL